MQETLAETKQLQQINLTKNIPDLGYTNSKLYKGNNFVGYT